MRERYVGAGSMRTELTAASRRRTAVIYPLWAGQAQRARAAWL